MTPAARSGLAWLASLALTALLCGRLIEVIATTRQTFDADEAVHAVESLRRYDDLEREHYLAFFRDCYFPERWQPPVQDHLRWYPIVHSLSQVLSFEMFEPGDFSARLPSILWLGATCLMFHALAKRIAPRHGDVAGVLAVVLLLAAPNGFTFAPQSMIESCSMFWAAASLYAYVGFVERPSRRGAVIAGVCLAFGILTKYDHGLLAFACLGAAELARQRGRVLAVLRSHAVTLFGLPAAVFAAWVAHPDKWQAFRDTLAHPAYGSVPVIGLNFCASWLIEYTSSPAVVIAVPVALYWALRREQGSGLRAVAIYAGLSILLLTVRARFQFRYNIVETTMALLLVASLTPTWVEQFAGYCATASDRALRRWGAALGVLGAAGVALIAALALAPGAFEHASTAVARPVFGLVAARLGLTRGAEDYVRELTSGMRAALALDGWTFVATPLAMLIVSLGLLALRESLRTGRARGLAAGAAALAVLPGALQLHSPGEFSRRLHWELECIPALNDVVSYIDRNTPERARILLAGGWDQFPNNALTWYLQTRRRPRPGFEQIEVVGDMIGSLVLPSSERLRQWATVLARDTGPELPDRIVLIEPGENFHYQIKRSPEVALYRAVIAARGGYRSLAVHEFDDVGCRVEILMRDDAPPPPLSEVPGLALIDAPQPTVGLHGWVVKDDAWRHLRDPARSEAR